MAHEHKQTTLYFILHYSSSMGGVHWRPKDSIYWNKYDSLLACFHLFLVFALLTSPSLLEMKFFLQCSNTGIPTAFNIHPTQNTSLLLLAFTCYRNNLIRIEHSIPGLSLNNHQHIVPKHTGREVQMEVLYGVYDCSTYQMTAPL